MKRSTNKVKKMKRARPAISPIDFETSIVSFLDIVGNAQTPDTARQFLEATDWQLHKAVELFYVANDAAAPGPVRKQSPQQPPCSSSKNNGEDEDEVRPPLPVRREVLYGGSLQSVPDPGAENRDLRELEDNLAGLYVPPHDLIFDGCFEKAKEAAAEQNKWLLVNLQSRTEFSSHMLNRDTWKNKTVAEIVGTYFVFWQKFDDTVEGKKVRAFYRLDSVPAVVIIDPVTGQKMKLWSGMVEPEIFLEDVVPFMDSTPNDHLVSQSQKRRRLEVAAPLQEAEKIEEEEETMKGLPETLPLLPEEPDVDRTRLCRVGLRFPDGHRVQRNFLRADPIQLLWSLCYSELQKESKEGIGFQLVYAVPGAAKSLDYQEKSTFEESGIANSLISVVLDN